MLLYVHFRIGVQWNHRLHYNTFPCHLVYPYEAKATIVWICLVIQGNTSGDIPVSAPGGVIDCKRG
jgi:hypothetical protein